MQVRGMEKDRLHLTVQPSATPIQSSKAGLRADDKPMHLPSVHQWLWHKRALETRRVPLRGQRH